MSGLQNPNAAARLLDPQQQNDLLLYRLYRILSTAAPRVTRLCEQLHGISRREWRLLATLREHDGVLSSQLAEHTVLDRARTSRGISNLVDKGLVQRVTNPADRREARLYLTDKGQHVHADMWPRVAAIQSELLSPFSAAERQHLSDLLQRLQASADRISPGGTES